MSNAIVETGHIVNLVAPVDLDLAAVTSDAFSMQNYNTANIIVQLGVKGAATTITVEKCTTAAGAGATAIAFKYRACLVSIGTALCDQFGAWTSATAAGFATSTTANIMYYIMINGSEVADGGPWVRLKFTDPGAATFGSAIAILTDARYGAYQTPTAVD